MEERAREWSERAEGRATWRAGAAGAERATQSGQTHTGHGTRVTGRRGGDWRLLQKQQGTLVRNLLAQATALHGCTEHTHTHRVKTIKHSTSSKVQEDLQRMNTERENCSSLQFKMSKRSAGEVRHDMARAKHRHRTLVLAGLRRCWCQGRHDGRLHWPKLEA